MMKWGTPISGNLHFLGVDKPQSYRYMIATHYAIFLWGKYLLTTLLTNCYAIESCGFHEEFLGTCSNHTRIAVCRLGMLG
jgi:hypothetical protein